MLQGPDARWSGQRQGSTTAATSKKYDPAYWSLDGMEPYDADTKLHDKVLGKDGFPFEGTDICFFRGC